MSSSYLGSGLILTDVVFQNKGQAIAAPVIIDTGAEGFAAVDLPFAQKLGIDRTLSGFASGVGGSTLAWQGTLDAMTIKDLPQCVVGKVSVGVSDIPTIRGNAVALLGVNFMEETGLSVKFGKNSVQVGCDAAPQPISIPIKALAATSPIAGGALPDLTTFAIGAGVVGAAILLIIYLWSSN
jgi:hypothetical protein